jgi:hypothetical protein
VTNGNPGSQLLPENEESGSEVCDDGIDNDGDNLIDNSDQDCVTESEVEGADGEVGLPTEEEEEEEE